MTVLLWVLAFLGVILIYGGAGIIKLVKKSIPSTKTENLIKLVGVLISAAALVMLYVTGSFI